MSDEASLERRSVRLPGGLPAQLGPFALLGLAALYLHRRMTDLPARFAVHWNAAGRPDRFVPREEASHPLLAGAAAAAAVLVVALALRWLAPRGDLLRRVLIVLLVVEYELALVFSTGPLSALDAPADGSMPRLLTWTVLMILAGVLASLFILARGRRAPLRNPAGYHSLYYSDRSDPSLFVPKRTGLGYTINFGHPLAWPALFGMLLLPLAVVLVVAWRSLSAR